MTRRRRFACLLAVLVFLVLRALSHAHPAPPPWVLGVFDGGGLDDVLQGIRIPYVRSIGVPSSDPRRLHVATGRIAPREPFLLKDAFLATLRSRAPPSA